MKTDQFINILTQDLATRPASAFKAMTLGLPLATAVMLVSWLAMSGVRSDLLTAGLAPTMIKAALGLLLTGNGVLGALLLTRPERHAEEASQWLVLVPVAVSIAVGAELSSAGPAGWQERLFGHSYIACLLIIPTLALAPLIAAMLALRKGATTAPVATGALAGVGAGGIAMTAYGLYCTEDSTLFIGTWYVLAGCVPAIVGALVGRVALRW